MATERYYYCSSCHRRTPSSTLLFHVLIDFPKSVPTCSCGGRNELLLTPPFAFGAGGKHFQVLDVFHEKVSWEDKEKLVTFYPFLVVLKNTGDKSLKVWMPYWHTEDSKVKFGERAAWMDAELFDGLLSQARAKNYFRNP